MAQDKRNDPADDRQQGKRRGADGKELDPDAGAGASIPRGTDEHSDDAGRRAERRDASDDDVSAGQVDPEGQLGASRREPGR